MKTSALEALLIAREWRAADEETRRLILDTADQGGFSGLESVEVRLLDCELILAIDDAWRSATADRFGLTPQAQILADTRALGHSRKATWRVFGTQTGWVRGGWLTEDELSYELDAPPGHLPWIPGTLPTVVTGRTYEILFLFYGLVDECRAGRRDQLLRA